MDFDKVTALNTFYGRKIEKKLNVSPVSGMLYTDLSKAFVLDMIYLLRN